MVAPLRETFFLEISLRAIVGKEATNVYKPKSSVEFPTLLSWVSLTKYDRRGYLFHMVETVSWPARTYEP